MYNVLSLHRLASNNSNDDDDDDDDDHHHKGHVHLPKAYNIVQTFTPCHLLSSSSSSS